MAVFEAQLAKLELCLWPGILEALPARLFQLA